MPRDRKDRTIPILTAIILSIVILYALVVVVPNLNRRLDFAHHAKAQAEINSIETALTAMLADASCRDFQSFLDMEEFARVRDEEMELTGADEFAASVQIYSTLMPILLNHGNDAGDVLDASVETRHLRSLVPDDILRRLGSRYMDSAPVQDPWDSTYRYYFGSWPSGLGPIPLRVYMDTSPDSESDELTVSGENDRTGFPPPSTKPYYIWSPGKNRRSDQAIFDPSGEYPAPASQHYRPDAEPEYLGGGDDINNWDKNESFMTFYRFWTPPAE